MKYPIETQEELIKFYGNPGTNITSVKIPFKLKLSWTKGTYVDRIQVNEKLKDEVPEILNQILLEYTLQGIYDLELNIYGGGYNFRNKRDSNELSTHAYGAALDFNPLHNPYRATKDTALFAKPEYNEFWRIWERYGWVSLGRTKNFDWMHIQAVNLKT